MKTVNSLSGGKTSSYLEVHYPSDISVFALCCIDDHNAGKSIDKKIKQEINDRLQKYCPHQPEFKATSEDPKILKVILDLEQLTGKEIVWLRGIGWEKMLDIKKALPNKQWRFCTSVLKMIPIFEYLYKYSELPVVMRLGYRYDEKERAENALDSFKFSNRCEYRPKSNTWIHRWETVKWRFMEYPLIEDRVTHPKISKYWENKGIDFPIDSNCLNCFWKPEQQLRRNFNTHPEIMNWAAIMEVLLNRTFISENSFLEIKNMGIQIDFFEGTGAGCQAGFCTN